MRAVVLVGGEGTRLRPLTLTVPKQALPIVEVPMIMRVLSYLAEHGVTDVVLSLGYRHQSFVSLFPESHACGVALSCAIEPQPLGTAGAVRFAARAAGIDERCVVVNGDVLTDLDLGALMDFHATRRAEGTIALGPVDDPSAFGQVVRDEDGRVKAFLEKGVSGIPTPPAPVESLLATHTASGPNVPTPEGRSGPILPMPTPAEDHGATLVNAGTYVLEPSVFDRIPDGRPVSIEREVFPAMANDGTLFALGSDAYWADTGTPAQYLRVQLDLLSGRRPGAPIGGAVLRANRVWMLGPNVVEGDVEGPAFIGQAAFVESGAHVARSVVSSGARVHDGARVTDSVLLPGVVVRKGAVVDTSLIGERALVGEKAWLSDQTMVGFGVEIPAGTRLEGARVPEG